MKKITQLKKYMKRIIAVMLVLGIVMPSFEHTFYVQASEVTYTLVCEDNIWKLNGSPLVYCSDKGGWDNNGWCYKNNYGTLVGENTSSIYRLGHLDAFYYSKNNKTWTELFECEYCAIRIWLTEKPDSLTLKTGNDYTCTKETDGSFSVENFPMEYAIYCAGDTTYTIEKIQIKPCTNCKQQTLVTVEGVGLPETSIVYNGQPVQNNIFGTPVFKNGSEQITGIEAEYTYYKLIYYGKYDQLDSNPTEAGLYKVDISVPDSNPSYMGNIEIDFTIARADKIEVPEGDGYQIDYENRTITAYEGYEISKEAVGENSLCVAVDSVTPGTIYYIRSTNRNYINHPWTNIVLPSQPAAPADVKGIAPSTATEKNGKITGLTAEMEYTTDEGQSWISVPDGTSELSVAPGNYGVRLKATTVSFSSETATIKVNTYEAEHTNNKESGQNESNQNNTDNNNTDNNKDNNTDNSNGNKQSDETGKQTESGQDNADKNPGNSGDNTQPSGNTANISKTEKLQNSLSLDSKFKVYIKNNAINVKWGEVKDATGYDIYMAYSDTKFSSNATKNITSEKKTSAVIKKLDKKMINQKKIVQCYVVAYKTVNGKKITLGNTIKAYAAGKKCKVTDAKKLSVKKTSYSLKTGKSVTIRPKTVKSNKNKQIYNQIPEFRYKSSDASVATVSKGGKTQAKKKGVCQIYVYAVNGYARKIKVGVE